MTQQQTKPTRGMANWCLMHDTYIASQFPLFRIIATSTQQN
uniref:Uncharacterized protein n=1 Tax=Arundo donax TaxID=35708 RepID=A0A0A8Z5T4_ARUDO